MSSFRKSGGRAPFESIVIAVILALFIRTFVVQAFKIPTGSMEPNLLIGDHLLVNKFVFGPGRRGDVIVFKYPEDPERDFIKRVIGLPGDSVQLRSKRMFINGEPIEEPYAHVEAPPRSPAERHELASLHVRGEC